jgi:hypothetical protein
MASFNRALNVALILMLLASPVVLKIGYHKWVGMEDSRRGQ